MCSFLSFAKCVPSHPLHCGWPILDHSTYIFSIYVSFFVNLKLFDPNRVAASIAVHRRPGHLRCWVTPSQESPSQIQPPHLWFLPLSPLLWLNPSFLTPLLLRSKAITRRSIQTQSSSLIKINDKYWWNVWHIRLFIYHSSNLIPQNLIKYKTKLSKFNLLT